MNDQKKSVYKPRPVSGFPEWLPEVRYVEQQWFDHIRAVFESYGFCSIETPSVEELEVLHAKGEVDKEIYVIERLHKEEGESKEARLALHFDQTVPLARYVAQNFNELVFPFKRYQMQRVWRGERPQAGRFREFYQCDIDVINVDALPLHFDAELPAIMYEVMKGLPGMENEKIQIRISNRKVLIGILWAFCADKNKVPEAIKLIDKADKTGRELLMKELKEKIKIHEDDVLSIITLLNKYTPAQFDQLRAKANSALQRVMRSEDHGAQLIEDGLNELDFVMKYLSSLPNNSVVTDLSVARGLDYYTGTVYETVFTDNPGYGSICSGGRYEDLASQYINKKLPGVGISIGFSRLFAYLADQKKLPVGRKSPADILMVLPNEESRAMAADTARTLRGRGFRVEMYHAPKKFGDQIKYAERKGIPYVWFPGDTHKVKDMAAHAEQENVNPQNWRPDGEKKDAA